MREEKERGRGKGTPATKNASFAFPPTVLR